MYSRPWHNFDNSNRLFDGFTWWNLEELVLDFTLNQVSYFAVVDKEQHLLGIVHFNNIREIIFLLTELNTLVKDIMAAPIEVIIAWKQLWISLNAPWPFPVIKDEKYFGFISKSETLEPTDQNWKQWLLNN
jgi:CIC family chloride channel protein